MSDALYTTIHRLNDDILLDIFNWYRLENAYLWNSGLRWFKLSHVNRRWRHLIYQSTSHLGMHIGCENGSPIVDTLDHIPPLPLFVNYGSSKDRRGKTIPPGQDELEICHALRLHDRIRHVKLTLPFSISQKVLVLLDKHFPILEHLSLSLAAKNSIPLALPKAFIAPNLRHLALAGIGLTKRLRLLTSTVSLVTLNLYKIETSSCIRPRLLVARLQSLTQLKELSIDFSIPIPRPSTERDLLGEKGAPVILPSLTNFQFKGVGAYLDCLIAQIRAPLLEHLGITLFNQIVFALPHLSRFINISEGFKPHVARANFFRDGVSVTTAFHGSRWLDRPFQIRVKCKQLDWQIDCAVQICNELLQALSSVEEFRIECPHDFQIPTALQDGAIDGTTWHELLRSFASVKELHIYRGLTEEVSRALQVDDVGSDLGFLPNLQSINALDNLFTSFTDTRQVVGRPVQFSRRTYY